MIRNAASFCGGFRADHILSLPANLSGKFVEVFGYARDRALFKNLQFIFPEIMHTDSSISQNVFIFRTENTNV